MVEIPDRFDLVAQFVKLWTSKPNVAGLIPTVVKQFFRLMLGELYPGFRDLKRTFPDPGPCKKIRVSLNCMVAQKQ